MTRDIYCASTSTQQLARRRTECQTIEDFARYHDEFARYWKIPGFKTISKLDVGHGVCYSRKKNHLHPMVREDMFWSGRHEVEDNADLQISDPLEEVCMAVSKCLEQDWLLPFWYTIFFEDANEIEAPHGFRFFEYDGPGRSLSEGEKQATTVKLWELSYGILFGFHTAHNDPYDAIGWTRPVPDKPSGIGFPGCATKIWLCSDFYHGLVTRTTILTDDERACLRTQLFATIMHELAYAAIYAMRGASSDRPPERFFFPGSAVAEEGDELEARIFGGKTIKLSSLTNSALGISMHGCGSLGDDFTALWPEHMPRHVRGVPQGIESRILLCNTVPATFHQRFCTRAFWDEEVAAYGREALRLSGRRDWEMWLWDRRADTHYGKSRVMIEAAQLITGVSEDDSLSSVTVRHLRAFYKYPLVQLE